LKALKVNLIIYSETLFNENAYLCSITKVYKMRKPYLLALLLVFAVFSCKKEDNSTGQPSGNTPTANVIKGKCADSTGKGLAGATLRIYGTTLGTGSYADFDVTADAQGNYSLTVPEGVYGIDARYQLNWEGAFYDLALAPEDGKDGIVHESANGVVKNFVWKLSGKTPDYLPGSVSWKFDYYGGPVTVTNEQAYYFYSSQSYSSRALFNTGDKVRLVFTPDGPLMDGTTGSVITRELTVDNVSGPNDEYKTGDIPLGKYTVSASLISSSGTVSPMKTAVGYKDNNGGVPKLSLSGTPGSLSAIGSTASARFYMSKSLSTVAYDSYLTETVIFVIP
jgi:hypothetical protein